MCCTHLEDSRQEGILPCSILGLVVAVWANPWQTILYHKQLWDSLPLTPPRTSTTLAVMLLVYNSPPGENVDRELILKNKARTLTWQGT